VHGLRKVADFSVKIIHRSKQTRLILSPEKVTSLSHKRESIRRCKRGRETIAENGCWDKVGGWTIARLSSEGVLMAILNQSTLARVFCGVVLFCATANHVALMALIVAIGYRSGV
jgi:hypothetical protein